MNETSSKVSVKIVDRKPLAAKAGAKKGAGANNAADEIQDLTFQRAEPADYSEGRQNSRYTLWKTLRCCHTFPRDLDV